ncbi:MAG: pilus assembly protein PilM [Candidatus Pacebacteria bacterium]|nr:pilus assembly protein PilM [Candidatus Paceibacterota bacterium]
MLNLFNKNSIGLDIADQTIEVAELEKTGDDIGIVSLGRTKMDPGIVELGRIKDEEKLLKEVKKVFARAKPISIINREIIFGLPESQVYTSVFVLKTESKDEREQLIYEEVRKTVPLVEDDLTYSYRIIGHDEAGERILLVATSKEVVLEWQNFFKKAGLDVKIFDIETLAVFRGLFSKAPDNPTFLIDIGSKNTNIAIFDKKGLRYSYSVLKAGDYFTEKIAEALGISIEKAEEEKIKTDLIKDNQLVGVLIRSLEPIVEEIKPLLNHFQKQNENKRGEVVLIGGSSQIKGLADYLSDALGAKVRLGGTGPSLVYLESIGLALRGFDSKWDKKDPSIEIIKEEKKGKKEVDEESPFLRVVNTEVEPSNRVNVEDDFGLDNQDLGNQKSLLKLKKQKKILMFILITGILLVGASFLYRSGQRSLEEKLPNTAFQDYQFPKFMNLQVPVAIEESEYSVDRVRGRKISSENEKKPEESLIKVNSNEWLAYSEMDAQKMFISEIEKNINVEFILDNVEYQSVEPSDNPVVYFLKSKVNILTKEEFILKEEKEEVVIVPEKEEEETSEEKSEIISPQDFEEEVSEDTESEEQVLIKNTPTGWLNVRSGPDVTYIIITKINPGEKYIIIEEKEEWVKIKLSEDEEGWVYSVYVEKIK